MKTTGRVLVIAFALGLAGHYSSTIVNAAAQTAPATATRKGVIKKLDDTTLILQPADAKNTEATYTLSSETKRTGRLAAGEEVVISYHYERGKVIVTAVAGKSSK
jgi:hypothetical protein